MLLALDRATALADVAEGDSAAVARREGARDALADVAALARGDREAIARVYAEHHVALRAFAQRLVGDAVAAEDVVHEVFVTLPSAVRRFRGESALRTFLFSIAVNEARHSVRSAVRRRAAMARLGAQAVDAPPPSSPEARADRAELARALTRALDELPMEQRVVFVLCEVEERTSREAAEIVRAPEATVRTRLFHARQKLRAALAREGFR